MSEERFEQHWTSLAMRINDAVEVYVKDARMRNSVTTAAERERESIPAAGATGSRLILPLALLLAVAAGCADQKALEATRKALTVGQNDQAIAQADAYLQRSPRGAGASEALYLRGRAYEQRTASSAAEATANLRAARASYVEALSRSPRSNLEAYVRTSLGNVAFYEEDYTTALTQLASAYEHLNKPELQSWALYRMGLCQQRLGRFVEADRSFALVEQTFPRTQPAPYAREHMGVRSFYVQLAAFDAAAGADKAAAAVRRSGVPTLRLVDARGHQVVRVGPYATYAQARAMKQRFADEYADAMILP
jgi:TolA-binding protein